MKKFLITLLATAFSLTVFSQTLPSAALDNIKKATVFIEVKHKMLDSENEASSSGSGFFVSDKGLIATNYHVIQASLSDYNTDYPTKITRIRIILNSGTTAYRSYNATIVSVDKDNDLALLAIPDSAEKFPFVEIDTSKLKELMPVWIFGYPFGDQFTILQKGPEITVNNGSISALRHDDRDLLTRIQIDAVINHGNSGGAVVNENGKVVGVINSMMGSSRINFAVPAHYLGKMTKVIPADFTIYDSTAVRLKTVPEDVSVFIDWESPSIGAGGAKPCYKKNGLHVITAMKKGYTSLIKEVTFTGEYNDTLHLLPEKIQQIRAQTGKNREDTATGKVRNPGDMLLKENFDDPKRFAAWEQSTGGETERTWYVEESALHQFENSGTLHAIYLGDSVWNNYSAKVKVKLLSDEAYQSYMKPDGRAGIIFRETKEGFYLFRIHKETNKVQLAYHNKSPFGWYILKEKKLDQDIVTDKWYNLRADVYNNTISCHLNDTCMFVLNTALSPGGRVGFYSVDSKPVFDSLEVTGIKEYAHTAGTAEPAPSAFWFTDNFDLKSNWWYTYILKNNLEEIVPFRINDGTFSWSKKISEPAVAEFTRFSVQDFSMSLYLSLEEGSDSSVFELFIRKENNSRMVIRFDKKAAKISVIRIENGKEKILKQRRIPSRLFGSTSNINIKSDGNSLSVGSLYYTWIRYSGKHNPGISGRVGFSSRNLGFTAYQMSLSSLPQPVVKDKPKKK